MNITRPRLGEYATYKGCTFALYETGAPGIYELLTRTTYNPRLKDWGFLIYDKDTYHKLVEKEAIDNAFFVKTYTKYLGFKFFLESVRKNGQYVLRPSIEAMRYFNKFSRQGYDPMYEIFESEVTDIWEERSPVEGFEFTVEPIVYLKKDRVWLIDSDGEE